MGLLHGRDDMFEELYHNQHESGDGNDSRNSESQDNNISDECAPLMILITRMII